MTVTSILLFNKKANFWQLVTPVHMYRKEINLPSLPSFPAWKQHRLKHV